MCIWNKGWFFDMMRLFLSYGTYFEWRFCLYYTFSQKFSVICLFWKFLFGNVHPTESLQTVVVFYNYVCPLDFRNYLGWILKWFIFSNITYFLRLDEIEYCSMMKSVEMLNNVRSTEYFYKYQKCWIVTMFL